MSPLGRPSPDRFESIIAAVPLRPQIACGGGSGCIWYRRRSLPSQRYRATRARSPPLACTCTPRATATFSQRYLACGDASGGTILAVKPTGTILCTTDNSLEQLARCLLAGSWSPLLQLDPASACQSRRLVAPIVMQKRLGWPGVTCIAALCLLLPQATATTDHPSRVAHTHFWSLRATKPYTSPCPFFFVASLPHVFPVAALFSTTLPRLLSSLLRRFRSSSSSSQLVRPSTLRPAPRKSESPQPTAGDRCERAREGPASPVGAPQRAPWPANQRSFYWPMLSRYWPVEAPVDFTGADRSPAAKLPLSSDFAHFPQTWAPLSLSTGRVSSSTAERLVRRKRLNKNGSNSNSNESAIESDIGAFHMPDGGINPHQKLTRLVATHTSSQAPQQRRNQALPLRANHIPGQPPLLPLHRSSVRRHTLALCLLKERLVAHCHEQNGVFDFENQRD